jgi:hypothetical protein
MVAEFDDVAGWTADAVEQLGRRHAIPAACRGSASPAALAWSRHAEQVAAVVATRHQAHPAHALAAHQGERFTHLFASGGSPYD